MRSVLLQILVLIFVVGGAGGAYFYGSDLLKPKKAFVKTKKAKEKIWPVRTVQVAADDHVVTRQVFGRVGAGRASDLSFQISGCVDKTMTNLKSGVTVHKGELLARLDTRLLELNLQAAKSKYGELHSEAAELATKLKNIAKLKENSNQGLALAKRAYDRQKGLVKRGVSSSITAEKAEKVLRDASTSLVKIENDEAGLRGAITTMARRLESARQAIDKAKLQTQYATLHAPHDGVIGRATLETGSCVSAMAPMVRLIDVMSLEILLDVPVHMYKQLQAQSSTGGDIVGQKVSVLLSDEQSIEAKIERISPEIDDKKQMVQIVVKPIDPAKARVLLSGQKVRARIEVRKLAQVFKIPASAIFDGRSVFTIDDDRLVMRKIEVLARNDQFAFVRGELKDGNSVLTTPLSQAMTGLKIKVLSK